MWSKQRWHQRGMSLVELLVAIGLSAILIPGLFVAVMASREGKAQELQRLQATAFAQEATEAVRSVRERDWSELPIGGLYHPVISNGSWTLMSGSQTQNGLTRSIELLPVYRDSAGSIVPSGTLDPGSLQAQVTVSWETPLPGTFSTATYLTRHPRNQERLDTTETDFDTGVYEGTEAVGGESGSLQLLQAVGGSASFTEDFTVDTRYQFPADKIEVLDGVAQLKSLTVGSSGSTSNPDFSSNLAGWTYSSYGASFAQTGAQVSSGGIPGGMAQLSFPQTRRQEGGGYFRQSFTTSSANTAATLTFNWRVPQFSGNPTSLTVLAAVDTGTGAPSNIVWSSGPITGTTAWSGTVTVPVSAAVASAGTYHLKMGAYVVYPNPNRGPYTVAFDNVQLNWESNATYASDSPTITFANSIQPPALTAWESFSTEEVLNGGSIRYQLSSDDGASWLYYDGSAPAGWKTVSQATHFNDASTVNQQIPLFPTAPGKVRVRAFLIGNGTQKVQLDSITVGYEGGQGPQSGSFTSGLLDATTDAIFNRILWTETEPGNSSVRVQVGVSNQDTGWTYFGPDGTSSTYFTDGSGVIPLPLSVGRYFRYRVFLDASGNNSPSVEDIVINYSE